MPRLAKATSNLFRFRDSGKTAKLSARDLDEVISVDPDTLTAEVQGMTTYEHLVDATLPHGLMPYVVPQLKTITLGGAVTGLGIESTSSGTACRTSRSRSWRSSPGTAGSSWPRRTTSTRDLFRAFPNSYGTLGYALRIRIKLEQVEPYVRLTHIRFTDADKCMLAMQEICESRAYDGEPVDFVDGVYFDPGRCTSRSAASPTGAPYTSDYTGMRIYYQSIKQRNRDWLTIRDYLWRWDTDWFWCSRAFGVQQPVVRSLVPRSWMRSDVYRKLVALDRRYGVIARIDRWRRQPVQESVIQDIEVPVERAPSSWSSSTTRSA